MRKSIVSNGSTTKEFRIIEEGRKVIGTTDKKRVTDEIDNVSPRNADLIRYMLFCMFEDESLPSFVMNDQLKATAYCDPRDEFNEDTGINVCSEKLDWKNHIQLAKKYDRMHRWLLECANVCYRKCVNHYEKACAIEDDMARMYGRKK